MDTYILLFDLDGTLVNTDLIYVKVWNEILNKYYINCDKKFFDHFIKGKSDNTFLNYIISSITKEEIINISEKKDELFIKYLKEEEKKNIILEGVEEFFKKYQNNKIAIVTSCNRKACEYILEYIGLTKYIDLVIASENCINHKPHPEPYLNAIKYFNKNIEDNNINLDNIFIFEDSYSGYCSAIRTNIKNICLIQNNFSSDDIIQANNFKYNNYYNLNLNNVLEFYKNNNIVNNDYITEIKNSLKSIPIKKIIQNNEQLKTGYICDINSYNITYINNSNENIVLKISNLNNELSKTAIKLNMYKNESFFYNNLSNLIPNTPKFFSSFKIDEKDAIILEDLNKYSGSFNIDLNKDIFLLLNVVKYMYNIHSIFHFKSYEDITPEMKNLKKVNEINYFKELINTRYELFKNNIKYILNDNEKEILEKIYNNIDKIFEEASEYPLNFCHGDLKSPNIFYKNNIEPIFLDWQYIHLNKGISDIVFLLVESIEFDSKTVQIVIDFYYKLYNQNNYISYENYMNDLKNALCIFPFFVCVWFNSETKEKLIDPIFPIKFLKNLIKYYKYFIS
jgi:beta-phosphoglucomutase-like phosphatase (HAD superfamily)